MGEIKNSPFKDGLGKVGGVPQKGTKGGQYNKYVALPDGMPGHDASPDGVPELYFDTAVLNASKSAPAPANSGPVKTMFKDQCSGR